MRLLCASAASICALAAPPASSADWRFVPSASSGVAYTDNPRLVADGESYAGATADVSAELSMNTEITSLSLAPRFFYARYPDDRLLDRNDVSVTLGASQRRETTDWTGSATYVRDTTITSEFGLTGFQNVNRDHEAVTLSLGPSWQISERTQIALQLYRLDSRYSDADNTGLVDYTYDMGALSGSYVFSETTSLGLKLSFGELNVPQTERRSRDIDASISFNWLLAETWQASIAYGPTRVEAESDSQGEIYSASLEKENVRSSLRFALERDVTPTGRGVMVTRDRVSVTAGYALTPYTNWRVTAQAIRTNDTIRIAGSQTNEFLNLESSLDWRFAEHWSVVLAAGGRHQSNEAFSGDDIDAEGFNVSLGLTWNGQPRTLSR